MNKLCYCLISFIVICKLSFAQNGQNEYEKTRVTYSLKGAVSKTIVDGIGEGDVKLWAAISTALATPASFTTTSTDAAVSPAAYIKKIADLMTSIKNNKENAAIIAVYRTMKSESDGTYTVDYSKLNSLIYHTDRRSEKLSNYLLGTKKIVFMLIDVDEAVYAANDAMAIKKLLASTIKIDYKTSFLRQGIKDAIKVFGSMGNQKSTFAELDITFIEVEPKRIKDPCDILLQNKSFDKDLEFPVHERNIATVQIGVVNNNFALNNFKITDGNLVVTPNDEQKTDWKSNMYAIAELHLPRDIENFKPLWKAVLGEKGVKREGWEIFDDLLLRRLGIYGGIRVSKDPLSNIYGGFNYAITKELSINLGWVWDNEVIPQVTEIGEISSLNDALKFAKRKYGKGKFSWGLSFAPSSIIKMLGIGDKSGAAKE